MYNKELEALFQRYRNNELTEEELQRLFELLQAQEHDEQLKAMLDNAWDEQPMVTATEPGQQPAVHPMKRWLPRVAAAVLVLCVGAGAYFLWRPHPAPVLAWHTESNAAGQPPRHVELPDHSTVWLNAGTTLQYQEGFAGTERLVKLEGEACFDVAQDPAKPFTVATGAVNTHVLGTRFNISNYPADKRIAVTVLSGKVSVQDHKISQPIVLGAGQETSYEAATFTTAVAEDSADIAWTRGELVFHKTPLRQVVRTLETRFNKKIVVPDVLQACVFYGDFSQETLADILSSMAVALNGQAREVNGTWYIDGKGCF